MNEIEQRIYALGDRLLAAYLEIHSILKSDEFSSIRILCIKSRMDIQQVKEAIAALDGPYGHSKGWLVQGVHDLDAGPTIEFHNSIVNKIRIHPR